MITSNKHYQIIIIGAGASGLFCALHAAKRGKKVLLLDHQTQAGKKLSISGGKRCNFTNLDISPEHYLSQNKHFCISALKRFSPIDCVKFFQSLSINYVEKQKGQLFCDSSAQKLTESLLAECEKHQVTTLLNCKLTAINKNAYFNVQTSLGEFSSTALVIASGGLSYPNLGASNFGYKIAEQFGLQIINTHPALVPLKFNAHDTEYFKALAGTACKVSIKLKETTFYDNLLFTHIGLSGPAILQISSYWQPKNKLTINLLPSINLYDHLCQAKTQKPKVMLKTILAELLPNRLAQLIGQQQNNLPLQQYSNNALKKIAEQLQNWQLTPIGTRDYSAAEVTAGGVDTNELSSKTFETKRVTNLYFIGEVIDVTGQLGGYNLQWAWSSAYCCSLAIQ